MKKRIRKLLEVVGLIPKSMFGLLCLTHLNNYMVNDWYMKRLIELGVFEWHDAPHLHSYLIHKRIDLDYWLMK